MMLSEQIVEGIGAGLRSAPPAGVSAAYVEGFLTRNRDMLVGQIQRTLDQVQPMVATKADALKGLREDGRLLRTAMAQLSDRDDPERERVVAGWLLTHMEHRRQAVSVAWLDSSQEQARRLQIELLDEMDRFLGTQLQAVIGGERRLDWMLRSDTERDVQEREGEIHHLRPATFPYTPCGITQADIDAYQAVIAAEREKASRTRNSDDTAMAQMGLTNLPPGLEVYRVRDDAYAVRYLGTNRGWFRRIMPNLGLYSARSTAIDEVGNGIFAQLAPRVLGESRSYRGLMRYFAPEVYDRLAPPERKIAPGGVPFQYKSGKGGFGALYLPSSFGMQRHVVHTVQIGSSGGFSVTYTLQGKRKPEGGSFRPWIRHFVTLMPDLDDTIPYLPYPEASGIIRHRMYDESPRRRFLYRLLEWLRWEPVEPVWMGYDADGNSTLAPSEWATTPLLRELEMVVGEDAPRVAEAAREVISGAWDEAQVDRVDGAIRGVLRESGSAQRLDVIFALMRHGV